MAREVAEALDRAEREENDWAGDEALLARKQPQALEPHPPLQIANSIRVFLLLVGGNLTLELRTVRRLLVLVFECTIVNK